MKRTNRFSRRRALVAGLCLGTALIAVTIPKVFSQENFVVTIEPPGVSNQVSPLVVNGVLYGAQGVHEEDFNRFDQTAPTVRDEIFFENNPALGHYSPAVTRSADQFGGADETPYMTVNPTITTGAPIQTTLFLVNQERYFGLWWSAGDPHNELEFFRHGQLVFKFITADVINFLTGHHLESQYFGNPNPGFLHQNNHEPYAFLNFFADPLHPNQTFDEVILTNDATTGFENDNETIARAYDSTTGEQINPGPVDPGPGEEVDVGNGGEIEDPGNGGIEDGGTIADDGLVLIGGNFTLHPGSNLIISVAGPLCPDSGKVIVNGHAILDGTLTLVPEPLSNFRPSAGQHWTLLVAAGGISGMFSQVVDHLNTSGLTRADIYSPNGFIVAYLPPGNGVLTLRSAVPIPVNNICDVNAVLVNALAPNANQLAAPFDVWINGLAQTTRFSLQEHFHELMAAPTPPVPLPPPTGKQVVGKGVISAKEPLPPPAPAPGKPRFNLWGSGFGSWQDLSSQGLAHGFHYVNAGFLAGADYSFLENYVVGLFGAYSHSGDSILDGNTGWGGLYAGFYKRGAYILGAVYGGAGSFDTSRSTIVGGRAGGSADTQQWASFVTVGYDFCPLSKLVIGPLVSASYAYVNMDGFTEHSNFAPLRVSGSSQEDWRTDLGFRAYYGPFQIGKVGIRPFVRATWTHSYKQNLKVPVQLVDFQGGTTTVTGPHLGNDFATINAGASIQWTPTVSTYLSYDGQVGRDNAQSNGVSGGFNISF